jgi:hypothetical protein
MLNQRFFKTITKKTGKSKKGKTFCNLLQTNALQSKLFILASITSLPVPYERFSAQPGCFYQLFQTD